LLEAITCGLRLQRERQSARVMTPERWRQVSELFHAALARDESQRAAFLRDACPDDEALRHEVASMLDQRADAEGFLEVPAFAVAVGVVAEDRGQSLAGRTEGGHMPRPRAPWWIHFCAASFLGYFGLLMFSTFYPPAMGIGGIENARADGLIVTRVDADSEAARAGVQPGDRLVAINGRRLRNLREQRALSASVSVGQERTWLFERSGRQFSVTVTPQRRLLPLSLGLLPIRVGLLASLVLAFVVIYSRPDDRIARLGALLLASMACSTGPIWPAGFAGTWRELPVLVGALLWPAYLSSLTIGPIMFSLFAVFPRRVIRRRWIWIAALLPGAAVTTWIGYFILLGVYQPERSLGLYLPAWFTIASFASIPAYFAAGIAMLVWNYHRLTDVNERRRGRVLLVGITVAGVGVLLGVVAFLTMLVGPGSGLLLLSGPPIVVIAGLLFVALPCSFAYAIVAQRLFDIRIIIRQGLQYAFARRSILLLAPALAAGFVVDLVVHAEQPLTDLIQARGWAYVTLAGLAAVVYRNRDGWMTSLDRRFFRERYDAHQILRQVIDDVRAGVMLDTVAPVVVSRMSAAFHSTFVALLVCEPHQRDFHVLAVAPDASVVPRLTRASTLVGLVRVLRKPIEVSTSPDWLDDELPAPDAAAMRAARVDLVAPIVTGAAHQREALLVLGTKRSEEPYGRDDRELVSSVAASLAVLLERRPDEGETDEAFAECPQCGACDGVHATRCAEDGTPLVRVRLPRVLGGRYTIRRRLGRGGMGTVYEAHDGALERRVAVKVIRDDIIGSPHAADRFRREALVAASFAHPNVVTVYDFGITDGARAYLVMERLTGATVGDTLRRDGRLASSRTLHVMRGVCQAVDAAHRRQLVHRDLKPDNIFLTTDDVPKVLDFGIAKFVRPALDSTVLTATGAVIGTRGYMSPEQVRGGAPDPSWDRWALAVVAYEMLAGRRPFADARSLDVFPALAPGPWIRLTDRHPELPSALDAVFARAFSLDPAERPTGALAFLGSLELALDG
jgi:tRNA A-37 threonylcarbamoyl transferase component Bud32